MQYLVGKCSNPFCKETSPVFYKSDKRTCKVCLRDKQRAYRLSEKGMQSHKKFRQSVKGLSAGRKRQHARVSSGRHAEVQRKYINRNRVTRKYLLDGGYFPQCKTCVEDYGHTANCAVANGAEVLSNCQVWVEWKHTGQLQQLPSEPGVTHSGFDDFAPDDYFEVNWKP